eukprot:evm.model.scf_2159.2 EVM.evm.TU.scf_2159.2   scf_2159:22696-26297(-)
MEMMAQPVAWRSEGDILLRKKVIDQIRVILGQHQAHSPGQAGFPDFVKRLELVLYKSAASKEEYSDPRTLLERLRTVAQQLQQSQRVPAYPDEGYPGREAPFAQRDESAYRGSSYAIPPVRTASDLFTTLDDPSGLDLSPRRVSGFVAGPDAGPGHAALGGDKKGRWVSMMPPESKALMSSDISDDGFVSAINETWSTSGTSSAAFTGVSDSSLWLGDTSNLWYSDELELGPDHGVETHSGASLDSIPCTPQGFSNVPHPSTGSRCNPVPDLPRRASCPGGINRSPRIESMGLSPRMDGVNVTPHLSPRICEGEFLGPASTPQAWKTEDTAMWDATTGCQGPLGGQDVGQQMFTSGSQMCQSPSWASAAGACAGMGVERNITVMSGPTLVGYDEGLRTVTTQSGHPMAGQGINDGFGGVVPVRAPGGDSGASRIAQPLDYTGSLARQPNGLSGGAQAPASGSVAGVESSGGEFLKTEGQMRKYALRAKVDTKASDAKKGTFLGDIPENAVPAGSMAGMGMGGSDGQQGRQVAKNSMLPPCPAHSGTSVRDAPKFSLFPQRGMGEDSQDGIGTAGVKDELAHAYMCKRPVCSLMCNHLRLVIGHVKACSKRNPSCGNCRWLGLLLNLHARNCHNPQCPLPCCK